MSKKTRKVLAVCMSIILACSVFSILSACSSGENYDIYIYNGKGENAEAMENLADIYEQAYTNINEAAVTEEISAILV